MGNVSGCCIALLLITALLPLAAYADQPPTVVYGSITIDGEDAPAGTVVRAVVDGTERAKYTIAYGGEYALPLAVDATDTGKPIMFFVDDIQAPQTVVVPDLPSGPIQLNLLLTTTATDVPTDTDSPAPTPASTGTPVQVDAPEGTSTQEYQQPIIFIGVLTYQGNAIGVPAGAEICAYIDGELRGYKVTTVDGQYGIPPDDFDPLVVTGGSTDNGRNITFTVDGVLVQEYHIIGWAVDALNSPHTLDLIVGSDGVEMVNESSATSTNGQNTVTDDESTGANTPGFGVPLVVAGLLVVCLLNRRKRKGDMI